DNNSEQLENVFPPESDLQEDNVQDQPQTADEQDQLDDSDDNYLGEQPVSQPEEGHNNDLNYQTQSNEQNELGSETNIHDQTSENQIDAAISPDLDEVVVQKMDSDQSEQQADFSNDDNVDNSQKPQATLETVPQTDTIGYSIWFSEELSVLGLGISAILFVNLVQIKVQQKYMLQILNLKITISSYFTSAYKTLERAYLVHLRFGKIKCRAGFTKEEALAFFRECQRLSISVSHHY
ncbi:MAG: hypothetical protein H5T49_05215, partial [Hadesarchaea archaeon]|nr:hypothetical protein [Hadesarchaea archaeon]